jgi:ABC-type dipeptide/oligopeptide/nickel transport system permease component
MTDPHDREPIDDATIAAWRMNYGLDKRTPAQASKWWADAMLGMAPAGCVAALGVALDELESLRKEAAMARKDDAQ